ncbi:MAG: methyltransferase domain-containing protein [Thermoanaerobaculia bacterium]|nr:methyltransferase domain-containing protein [Thermoanaerobaculia bacterium]
MISQSITGIRHETGYAYIARIGLRSPSSHRRPSSAIVLEDDVPLLGPANAPHSDIRSLGMGRYSFWHGYVYFSSSDNSDPRTNGRRYTVSFSRYESFPFASVIARLRQIRPNQLLWAALYWVCFCAVWVKGKLAGGGTRRQPGWPTAAAAPVNLQKRVTADSQLETDVSYALQVGQNYVRLLPEQWATLRGKTVLEIGPGINFGSVLLMSCFGARPMVADRFLAPWDLDYHPRFYSLLRNRIRDMFPDADLSPLDRVIAANSYGDVVRQVACALEDMNEIPTGSVDIVFSNAVLEHIYDPEAALASLSRISKPGGLGYHQVDFRYHKSMDRPLEFLLTPDAEFDREFRECHGECGNRVRPMEYARLFEAAGFETTWSSSLDVDEDYFREFIPRLRKATGSRYQHVRAEELTAIGVSIRVTKKV